MAATSLSKSCFAQPTGGFLSSERSYAGLEEDGEHRLAKNQTQHCRSLALPCSACKAYPLLFSPYQTGEGLRMAVPDYQSLMLPLLRLAGDREVRSIDSAVEATAQEFGLTDEDRRELLPSGRQRRFDNRVAWAVTYLKKAGLLESAGRGRFKITDRGLEVLRAQPPRIDVRFLERFDEFREFRNASRTHDGQGGADGGEVDQTPEEILEASYQQLRQALEQELLQRVLVCSPAFFEKLVVDLLVALGYGGSRKDAGEAVGRTGDDGIDGVIKEDRLGLDIVYIQAKRWQRTVGRPEVQAFAGSLEGQRARKGVFITTSQFTKDAIDYVGRIEKKIVLIDGPTLARLMVEHGVGVAEAATYSVRRIDLDYFDEGEA